MGSSYFGVPSMRNNERSSSSSSSSSRKSKKGGSDKPKQPQRGLGVAQLEQIRLRSQMGCGFPPSLIHAGSNPSLQEDMRLQGVPYGGPQSSSRSYAHPQSSPSTSPTYAYHPNFTMVYGDERANLRYPDSPPCSAPRWNPNSSISVHNSSLHTQAEGMASSHHFNHFEDSCSKRFDLLKPMGSSSQNSDSSDHEELDLELRLSI
ncbi:hypothetical protein Cgig2_018508 [Carnegiea gigantea]|uniref:Uncharacterized protein n=1 Tax=Carnegiea gigantea TaxID=171969 RepID=A0A9Q1JLE4_9CARY|nr:hypothetical protein Cgig2_018508 [Carnegiea gigantea]